MPVVHHFSQFGFDHWETGSLAAILRHHGVVSPHTGKPLSEAFLFGVAGGACMGYFSFAYQGYDPHVALLLRNTFDPFEKMLDRLGIVRDSVQSGSVEQAHKKLIVSLDRDEPVLVWADVFSLPYNALDPKDMWHYYPLVVYGVGNGKVFVSDRYAKSMSIDQSLFDNARSRVKKERFRSMTVDLPTTERFAIAAEEGIIDCLTLFFDGPGGKIPAANFGERAYGHWATLLQKDSEKQSWAKIFPPGRKMLAGLSTAYGGMMGAGNADRSRTIQSDFLTEAAALLDKPGLVVAAGLFGEAADAWKRFKQRLLPDEFDLFKNVRDLIDRTASLFREKGPAAESELRELDTRRRGIFNRAENAFPLTESQTRDFKNGLSQELAALRDIEVTAFAAMADAMAWKRGV